ncbi:helix-hairpin-helix domain-containing protein, partial [Xanthobacter tagetidis]
AKNQLVTRGIVPKATYDGISAQIIAKRAAK